MSKELYSSAAGVPTPLRVKTRYTSVADFIHGFCRAVDRQHLMVGLRSAHPRGSVWRFSVTLADGTPAFEGVGKIVDVVPSRAHAQGVGVKLEIVRIHEESRTMHRCLVMAREASTPGAGMPATSPPAEPVLPVFARGTVPPLPSLDDVSDAEETNALVRPTMMPARGTTPLRLPLVAPEPPTVQVSAEMLQEMLVASGVGVPPAAEAPLAPAPVLAAPAEELTPTLPPSRRGRLVAGLMLVLATGAAAAVGAGVVYLPW